MLQNTKVNMKILHPLPESKKLVPMWTQILSVLLSSAMACTSKAIISKILGVKIDNNKELNI